MDLIHSLRLLTNPARDAGFVFYLAGGVCIKLGATDGSSVVHFYTLQRSTKKSQSGGCAPRLRLTLLLAQKSKQKTACAALGMSGS
jgi:hypothetical protein